MLGERRMRVLHVTSSLSSRSGGPSMALLGMADAQRKTGLSVTVVATQLEGTDVEVGDQLKAAGVDVRIVGPARGKLLRHPDLSRVLDELIAVADVVHVHALWEEIQHLAATKARDVRVPYVITPHGMLTPWSLA